MNLSNTSEVCRKVKKILSGRTPLKKDCGTLCGKACCKGDSETGMLLFPGESTDLNIKNEGGFRLAVCNGKCNRDERPISCMFFPLFPTLDKNNKIKTVPDFRGYGLCPLVRHADEIEFSKRYLNAVRRAAEILVKNEECRDFILSVTEIINDSKKMIDTFTGGTENV